MKSVKFLFLLSVISVAFVLKATPIKSSIAASAINLTDTKDNPLPEGLVAVQYLENTNASCHVATPMRFCDIPYSAISLVYSISPNATADMIVNKNFYGRYLSSNGGYYSLEIGSYALKYLCGQLSHISFGTYNIKGDKVSIYLDMLHNVVKVNEKDIKVDVASKWSTVREALRTNTSNIRLFNPGGRPTMQGIRIHGFKCWVNDELLCDLQPVRFLNDDGIWEGAYYDFVSGDLFKASGSVLVIGPNK